ncbi:DUF72 domain-containing protein [Pararobbsia silviterrae]|uniref:DUF72 domain-containing protein n=1 Tax=Pararobbsia silviterrae TaxID=1792498 RepID=A0A494Y0F4_9BURK|nr:DUF72 domain-containing protein [Pararobbsia silviterrae]RKP55729.1 DUF72 domain-containing protein [Pararobbsia silviterrae]
MPLVNPNPPSAAHPAIKVGIGGWAFEPWRGTFYPEHLPQSKELAYASRELTAIEINGTYYGLQKPTTFAKWRDETPDGFVFSLKATRYATNRRVLAEAGDSIERFVQSGITELGPKLGPIVWQFAPTKIFDPEDFEAFVELLPKHIDSHALRHVLEVRHASFMTDAFIKLVRRHKMATVFTDSSDYPSFADLSTDFAYARLMCSSEKLKTGYAPKALDAWTERARTWAAGSTPDDLPRVSSKDKTARTREVFVFFINGAKVRAPEAARSLIARLAKSPK